MSDEDYVREIKTIKLCKMCKPLDDECNNLIDAVSELEAGNKPQEKLLIEALEIIKYGGMTTRNHSAYNLLNLLEIKELLVNQEVKYGGGA